MAESLGAAVLKLGVDASEFEAGFQQAKKVAAAQGTAIGNTFAGQVSSALATFGLGVSAVGFLKSSIDAAAELETITRKLSNTLGEQGAARALGVTRGLADDLGLSFTTLASTFGSFTAAASAAGTPLKVQEDLFAAVAKSAQALGLSNDELQGSLLALQQIASKGNVQMEELRGQLGERLPIAFSAAAKGLGVTQQELIKLVESGRLTSDQFFPALTKGLNDLTAASGGATTAAQNFQKLGNAWKDLQTQFGQNLLPQVIEGVNLLKGIVEVQGSKLSADRLGFGTGLLGNFGIFNQQALDSVAVVKQVQQQLALTDKQATALFYDAQKANGIKNIGLAKPEEVEAVLVKYRELAKLFREKRPDPRPALEAEGAAARAALEADKKRLNTITKISDRIKELQTKQKGLDVNGSAFSDNASEIESLQRQLEAATVSKRQQLAASILTAAQSKIEADAMQRQLQNAKELAGTEGERSRSELQRRQQVLESIKQAGDAERKLGAEIDAARTRGGFKDEEQAAKLVDQQKLAAETVRLKLIEGADALRQAGKQLSKDLGDALIRLTEVRSSEGGLNKFLSQGDQQRRAQQDFQTLLPLFREAQSRFTGLTGASAPEFSGSVGDVNQSIREFVAAVKAEDFASKTASDIQSALVTNTQALVNVNAQLLEATAGLTQKDWGVNVSVFADGTSQAYGDVVNRAI